MFWNTEYLRLFLTFLLHIVVSLLTLGCHDFKQSFEDAAKVAGIVGLQLICNTCITPEQTIDINMRETKTWTNSDGQSECFYLIYKQRGGEWGHCCCGSGIGSCSWQPSWHLASLPGCPDGPGLLTSLSWGSDCWQGWREWSETTHDQKYIFWNSLNTRDTFSSYQIRFVF